MEPKLVPAQRFLGAFNVMPNIKFESQEVDEPVILVLRAHPVTQIPWIFNIFVGFIMLMILDLILPNFLGPNQMIMLNIMVIVFLLSYGWLNFLLYYYNVGVITHKRVLDIDFYSILHREVSETRLNRVEDITSKTSGYFGSLFNYGTVFVQTAGAEVNIEFIDVPDPTNAVKIINQLQT